MTRFMKCDLQQKIKTNTEYKQQQKHCHKDTQSHVTTTKCKNKLLTIS